MNTNKITVIPSLVESRSGRFAKTDHEKAELLVNWFAQPPQPPNYSQETAEHYQLVEDEIASFVDMKRDEEMKCNYGFSELTEPHQSSITEEEVIEALRKISP